MALNFRTSQSRREFKRVPVTQIVRNPNQPRHIFDEQALADLADSIRQYGVITPITVRKIGGGYELIAGERRLRASKLAGLDTIPCYIMEAEEQDSSLMALVENLQRRDLDFFEEAQGLRWLTDRYGLTQQQAAEKVGKTQSAVANKLRLLRLTPETVQIIRENGLTERHARVLLRLELPEDQQGAAAYFAQHQLNVEQAEAYIERSLVAPKQKKAKKQLVFRDVRIFMNTLTRAVTAMKQAGVGAEIEQESREDGIVLTIRIPSATGN